MSYYVYILKSNRNRSYIGYTSNLEQRIPQHNRKHKGFTGTREFWELRISTECQNESEAIKLEKYLKSLKNSKKAIKYLEKLNNKSVR